MTEMDVGALNSCCVHKFEAVTEPRGDLVPCLLGVASSTTAQPDRGG